MNMQDDLDKIAEEAESLRTESESLMRNMRANSLQQHVIEEAKTELKETGNPEEVIANMETKAQQFAQAEADDLLKANQAEEIATEEAIKEAIDEAD